MKTEKVTWEKTKIQFLLRNSISGIYYARLFAGGKEKWKSLKTDVCSVAKARLPELVQDVRRTQSESGRIQSNRAIVTVGDAIAVYLDTTNKRVDMKDSTEHYWQQIIDTLQASWPELAAKRFWHLHRTVGS